VKHREIFADNLNKGGWDRGDCFLGHRFAATLELEAAIRADGEIVLDEQQRFLKTPPR
jgi:hypothetical protein